MATPGLDFFRVDRSARTRTLLTVAALLIAAGATSVGAHLMHRFTPHVGHLVSLAGSVVMLAGLFLGFGTMARMLFEDVYLAIREGGLLVHENGTDLEVSWDDLAGVDVDLDRGQLAVCKKSGERLVFHGGQSAPDIAARIEEAKRKAAYGLLRAPTA